MASDIDPTKPETGNASTASVRANFAAAKDEIEAQQATTENHEGRIAALEALPEGGLPDPIDWTPTLRIGGSSAGVTYAARWGRVQEVGAFYVVQFDLTLTAKGSNAGTVSIAGLPFTLPNDGATTMGGSVCGTNVNFGDNVALLAIGINATATFNLNYQSSSANTVVTEANITDATRLRGVLIFPVSAHA